MAALLFSSNDTIFRIRDPGLQGDMGRSLRRALSPLFREDKLKIVCAWCGKAMGTKAGGDGVSHGICPECLKKIRLGELIDNRRGDDVK